MSTTITHLWSCYVDTVHVEENEQQQRRQHTAARLIQEEHSVHLDLVYTCGGISNAINLYANVNQKITQFANKKMVIFVSLCFIHSL